MLYRQIVGIPMGTNCAPLVADLFLFCYERDFMKNLSSYNQADVIKAFNLTSRYLAHLSHRLICELIGYSWSGVRTSSSSMVRRRPSSVVNNFKHLLLQNRLPDQSQILCDPSLGRGNEGLSAACGSHDQDGGHAHIW